MKILILNSDYQPFLRQLYSKSPDITTRSYDYQLEHRYNSLFGFSNFYSKNFRAHGHEAADIYVNNVWLQSRWAKENGLSIPQVLLDQVVAPPVAESVQKLKRLVRGYKPFLMPFMNVLGLSGEIPSWLADILKAQVESYQPDVILNQDIASAGPRLMRQLKRRGRTLIAQHGVDLPASLDVGMYDFGISHIPAVVNRYRKSGIQGHLVNLGFEPDVLTELGPAPAKDIEVSFVGSVAPNHRKRIVFLENLASRIEVGFWVSNTTGLSKSLRFLANRRPEVWGRDMYDVLRRSKITLNMHIDAAEGMAGNLRMFEATGVGSFLMTDNLSNVATLFEPGRDLDVYDTPTDCVEKIKRYLADPALREEISRRGQARALDEHSFANRTREILSLIEDSRRVAV